MPARSICYARQKCTGGLVCTSVIFSNNHIDQRAMDGSLKQEVEELLSRTSALLSRGGANASLTFRLPPRSTLQVQNYLLQLACIKLTQGPSFQATSAQPSYATSPAKAMRTSPSMPTGARLGSPSSGPGRGVAPGGSRDESLLPSLRRLLSGNLSSPRGSPGSSPRGGARSPPSGGRSPIGHGGELLLRQHE